MAKALSFVGNFKGKIGNLVGYQLRNSNNAVTQGIRAYVAEVSNPKTEPQAIQRMKMAPAVNFYRQLSTILDNAWQGQKYGTRSRQYFMGLAMRKISGIPFIPKGEKRFFPGTYPVAQGALSTVSVTQIIGTGLMQTSLNFAFGGDRWGSFSQELINRNFGIKDGDRITIIQVVKTDLNEYIPSYSWFRVNTQSEERVSTVLTNSNMVYGDDNDKLWLKIDFEGAGVIVAGACIVSRLVVSGRYPQWLRSNSDMFCDSSYLATMMSTTAYEAALATYLNNTEYSSDWYLNLGLTSQSNGQAAGDSNLQIVSVDIIYVNTLPEPSNVAICTMSDGSLKAARSSDVNGYVCKYSSGRYLYSTLNVANPSNLQKIQAIRSSVDGWVTVVASEDDTPIING